MLQNGAYPLLLRFSEALGLPRLDFDTVEPLAAYMALTTFSYWMLAYGSVLKKIAALNAIDEILLARYHTPVDHSASRVPCA